MDDSRMDIGGEDREAIIEGLAVELDLSEAAEALLQEVGHRLTHEEIDRLAYALATGERSRRLNGWVEVSSGDCQGSKETITGAFQAVLVFVNMLRGGGRLIWQLYKRGEPIA